MDKIPKEYLYAFGSLVFGCGILVFVVGLFSDRYSWQRGLIGMIALWVIDFACAVYYLTRPDD
jgi:hypothetical protein